MSRLTKVIAVMLLLSASPAFAVSYFVPEDRVLIQAAESIFIGTAIASHPELNANGGVRTVANLRIEEVLKGDVKPGSLIDVIEMGGDLGEAHTVVFGAPRFRDGQRYLVFTETKGNGELTTLGMALGKFALRPDRLGRLLATHDDSDLYGFDANDEPYVDRDRDAARFMDYIREQVNDHGLHALAVDYLVKPDRFSHGHTPAVESRPVTAAAFTQASYLGLPPSGAVYRWPTPSVTFLTNGTQPTFDGPTAAAIAAAAWTNDPNSNVNYQVGGTTTQNKGLTAPDGVNAFYFNDPQNELGSFTGCVGGVNAQSGSAPLPDGSGSAAIPTEVDIVVSKNFSPPSCANSLMAHELGHTLGFRHADHDRFDGPCSAPLECSGAALMDAFVNCGYGANLQTWDANAVSTVYGTGPVCTNPSISSQPSGSSINPGQSANLTVSANGTSPTFQWYAGSPPNIGSPVSGGASASISVSPASTTTYFVRVSGCSTFVDSNAVTVTVTCAAPQINQQPVGTSITSGSTAQLTVGAGGTTLTYQWYQGNAPDTSTQVVNGTGSSVFVSPASNTNYWVRVSGACGTPVNSNTVTVTVGACAPPTISGASALPTQILPGQSSSLSATISGGTAQWYAGIPPDKSHPVAQGGASVTVTPATTTSYWLQVTSTCGAPAANSTVVTVTVGNTCAGPTVATPANQTLIAGQTTTITANAGGTAPLHYQWFRGPSGNRTTRVGTDSPALTTEAVSSALLYWVEVTNACPGGTPADSGTVTITPVLTRYRAARH